MTWFEESLYPHWRQAFKVEKTIFEVGTGVQSLVIFETPGFGRVLSLDGVIQVTEGDEFVYHEMLAHVPVLAHGNAKSVCIVGGGDGGMLREMLKHPGIETATLVEIDAGVIDMCTQYMPSISAGAFDDPRAEIIIADGIEFMAKTDRKFDVIVIDSTDPIGPGEVLFTEAFYADCAKRLTQDGIIVTQNGVPFLQPEELRQTQARLRPHYRDVGFFVAAVPTYVGGFMTLGWASHSPRPRSETLETIQARFDAAPFATRYYTPEIHRACFALPKFVQDMLNG